MKYREINIGNRNDNIHLFDLKAGTVFTFEEDSAFIRIATDMFTIDDKLSFVKYFDSITKYFPELQFRGNISLDGQMYLSLNKIVKIIDCELIIYK